MKGTFDRQYIEELQGRIETHHTLCEMLADTWSARARHDGFGGDLFRTIRYQVEDAIKENGDYIYDLLNDMYSDWSGINELRATFRPYPVREDEMHELYEAEDEILEENEAVAGLVTELILTEDLSNRIYLPINFIKALNEYDELNLFTINDDTLGIL